MAMVDHFDFKTAEHKLQVSIFKKIDFEFP